MKNKELNSQFKIVLRAAVVFVCLSVFSGYAGNLGWAWAAGEPPTPLLEKGHPVDWWFVFKFNTASFPGCGGGSGEQRTCPFGGTVQPYPRGFGQQFVYASSEDPSLQKGSGCAGETPNDPLGATFAQVYDNAAYYVIWNDQFYSDPRLNCVNPQGYCPAPWGHSKGLLAWNAAGEGLVLQVSTPSWPAAGGKGHPRTDGNTLGVRKGQQRPGQSALLRLEAHEGRSCPRAEGVAKRERRNAAHEPTDRE